MSDCAICGRMFDLRNEERVVRLGYTLKDLGVAGEFAHPSCVVALRAERGAGEARLISARMSNNKRGPGRPGKEAK